MPEWINVNLFCKLVTKPIATNNIHYINTLYVYVYLHQAEDNLIGFFL